MAGDTGPASATARAATGVDVPRTIFTLLLAVYGVVLIRRFGTYGFMDSVDLPIHEAGHIFFAPLGEFMGFLGGTLMQLIIPGAFVVYFLVQRNRWAASVVLWWVAQNLWNIAVYARDTRAQLLPLVGSGEHDWLYLLTHFGITRYDQQIAGAIRGAGVLVFLASVLMGLYYAGWRLPGGATRTSS